MRAVAAAAVLATVVSACLAGGSATVGPVRLDVPDGWRVTRSLGESLQMADGSADVDQDAPGAARAVFDVYVSSPHTAQTYRQLLRENNVGAEEIELTVDGRTAHVFEYESDFFGGRQIAVVVPSEEMHAVYRAARIRDNASFFAGKAAFMEAVRSMTFEAGRPA